MKKNDVKKVFITAIATSFLLLTTGTNTVSVSIPDAMQKATTADPEDVADKMMQTAPEIDLDTIPEYSEDPYVEINDNVPTFTDDMLITTSFVRYSDLDSKGRAGTACANLSTDLMPSEEAEKVTFKPSGWDTVKYDVVKGKTLYKRTRLIAYSLADDDNTEKNFITGTQYLKSKGIKKFQKKVKKYIEETGNHVLYRVTPVFDGDDLLAQGVLMEAKSVEDNGEGLQFYVYCYNVQPEVTIDYSTGSSIAPTPTPEIKRDYILNTNTKVIHYPSCRAVKQMKDKNKKERSLTSEERAALTGYTSCGICHA